MVMMEGPCLRHEMFFVLFHEILSVGLFSAEKWERAAKFIFRVTTLPTCIFIIFLLFIEAMSQMKEQPMSLTPQQLARMNLNKCAALEKKRLASIRQKEENSTSVSTSVLSETTNIVKASSSGHASCSTTSVVKKARVLPNWSAPSKPQLVYNRSILYCQTPQDATNVIQMFQNESKEVTAASTSSSSTSAYSSNNKYIVGFDIEWRVTFEKDVPPRKVATIQLCSEKYCAVLHVSNFGTGRMFLKTKNILLN
jgi:hypothetical protein